MAMPGLRRGWTAPRRHDHVIEIRPALRPDPLLSPRQDAGREEPAEVIAVDPLHLHDPDAVRGDEVLDVEQVILLDLRHPGRHPRAIRPIASW